jgi:hypothetical protein
MFLIDWGHQMAASCSAGVATAQGFAVQMVVSSVAGMDVFVAAGDSVSEDARTSCDGQVMRAVAWVTAQSELGVLMDLGMEEERNSFVVGSLG